jgi:hypothetical protein
MTLSKLKFISKVLENYRTGYCDKQQNCSCESCEENFTVEQAQRYIENEIDMIVEEKSWGVL